MSSVSFLPSIILQLTTLGLWKRVNLTLHPFGRFRTTMPTPPYAPPVSIVISDEHATLYPNLVWQ